MEFPVHIIVTSEYEEMNLEKRISISRTSKEFFDYLQGNFVYLTPDAEEELVEVK